jgi:VanZ family protein
MPSSPPAATGRLTTVLKLLAWLLLAVIAFSTLAPIGLRPETGASPNLERAAAYALFGLVFALAYPRRLWLGIGIIVVSAVGLELLQLFVATRHARLADAGFKLLGGGAGLATGLVLVHSLWPSARARP